MVTVDIRSLHFDLYICSREMESSLSLQEPQHSAPVPSPHPSSCLEVTGALDLTPEKPVRRKKNRRPVQLKQHNFHKDPEHDHGITGE